jgi:hypothetical protein
MNQALPEQEPVTAERAFTVYPSAFFTFFHLKFSGLLQVELTTEH